MLYVGRLYSECTLYARICPCSHDLCKCAAKQHHTILLTWVTGSSSTG